VTLSWLSSLYIDTAILASSCDSEQLGCQQDRDGFANSKDNATGKCRLTHVAWTTCPNYAEFVSNVITGTEIERPDPTPEVCRTVLAMT
jgi:hypothetical protein